MQLELLAPARNKDIGIAAIDCGADAVYIAGPSFGARYAAGNSIEEIAELCAYAHRFGASIYATVNTLIDESERQQAEKMMQDLYEAGVDAFIVQDPGILSMKLPPVALYASTQSVIRTPERAKELEKAGFSRLILERQLSLEQIRAIRDAVDCEIECFVHGALCVSYSGQCYLSEKLLGRSANRGCCAQPCRSLYTLTDAEGRVIVRDRSLLSLKDFRLDTRIAELVDAGVNSFKIEGRLKNSSYVKNIVRHYDILLDRYVAAHPEHNRASLGRCSGGFRPDPDLTFNRGYTEAFIDGTRGKWNSADAARSIGEYIGTIDEIHGRQITVERGHSLANGDGLSFVKGNEEIAGMRADVVSGNVITLKNTADLRPGMKVYRSLNVRFERELEKNMPKRLIRASIRYRTADGVTTLKATAESGVSAEISFAEEAPEALKRDAAMDNIRRQMSKVTDIFDFSCDGVEADIPRFYPIAVLNALRRDLAEKLSAAIEESRRAALPSSPVRTAAAPAFPRPEEREVMRTKYCIRHELGFCPKMKPASSPKEPLYLTNVGYKLRLGFDCKNCEMIVFL